MNVVLSCLYTRSPDPQRGVRLPADIKLLAPLLGSLENCQAYVFHDEGEYSHPGTSFIRTTPRFNVYFQRWHDALHWLIDHPEARWVWCVDGTDVVMLHAPWEHMQSGTLYVGSEENTVGFSWLSDNHPSVRNWAFEQRDQILLNAGLLGGDRETVMTFLFDLVLNSTPARSTDLTDMGLFNQIARRYPLLTGLPVHTVFRAYDHDHEAAWWAHK